MTAAVFGATLFGDSAHLVRVETRMGRGLSRVIMVGMPDAATREARERLPAALARHDFSFPKGKVLFNLVPAQLPKRGLPLDLALAVSLLIQDRQLPKLKSSILFLAELDLQGRLRPPARGTLLASLAALEEQCSTVITAPESAQEAAIAPGIQAYGLVDLQEVKEFLRQASAFQPVQVAGPADLSGIQNPGRVAHSGNTTAASATHAQSPELRLDDLRGQSVAREAAAIAVAGRHSLLLQGPPGTGKSMLARRLPGLLPSLEQSVALQLAKVEALLGPVPAIPSMAPFRAPHTSVSAQALLGGGMPLRPGEIARAHGGILFLDELPEFTRPVLEGMRQPLEEKEVRLQRAREWATYPADVMLVATSNPCACGFVTHPKIPCRCTPNRLQTYRNRISGPLQDRFDLFVEMGPVGAEELQQDSTPPHDEDLHLQLEQTRAFQQEQQRQRGFALASMAEVDAIHSAGLEAAAATLLRQAATVIPLSGRGMLRCLRVARTAADLDCCPQIRASDMRKALSFRPLPVGQETATAPRHSPGQAWSRRKPASAAQSPPLAGD
ncbi:MAG: YifB family Mg chelatase-like AAA ATPase [Planctomycetes bacterium]|nr:YifB family Mg chelatase-like AAA ATPase [Planctomycetota bacterium]MCP4770706.1 YifB family Mg chelatase-like AAA ATPase [Planctomycetota bacterium]MCP4861421.1 YifB family Mg chelatase-like AAA ATPase [Planctomycetota bacterium]